MFEAQDGEEIVFSRHITAAGTGEYRIDGRSCTAEAYNERLKDFGILVKARNFLVFQGDIENVASKSPKDLTALIEQISGSEELKQEYEEAMQIRRRAEDDQHSAFTKRKGLATQRKQMKEQKDEAEKHQRMSEDLRRLRVEHVLFKLFHIDFDASRHAEEIEEAEEALRAHEAKVDEMSKEMEEKRQLKATHAKSGMMLERKIAKHRADADRRNPSAVKTKEEIVRARKKLELAQKQLEKHAADAETSAADIARLERDLANVNAAEASFEADAERRGKKADVQLGAAQMEEYNRKKEEAGAKTFKLRQEREGLASASQADEETRARLAGKRDELEARLATLDEQREAETSKLGELRENEAGTRTELEACKTRAKTLLDEKRKSRAKQEHLTNKIEELSGKLREAKADRKESEREVRAQEAVVAMKRLLPGVYGRVTDLMKVSQKKYNLAVITVLGKEADAVVVEDSKTAKECVQYLKEQRISPMTFIPLREIKVHEPEESLRRIGGTAKLCLDVVNYDSSVRRAMIYAMGNDTVVCDAHAEAKRITFGGDRRFKVVSLDGTLIKKSGEMTGGNSGSLQAKAARFDAAEVEQLRADRQAAEESLARLRPVAALADDEAESAARVTRLERDLQYAGVDVKMCVEKIEKLDKDRGNIERELNATVPELESAERAGAASAAAVAEVEAKIHAIEDEVYADFSESVGVANIREYEENQLATLRRGAEERARFTQQRAKLTEQLNFERSRDVVGPRDRAKADIARHGAELERLTANAETAKAEAEAAKAQLEEWERDAVAAKAETEAVENELRDLRQRHGALGAEGSKIRRVVAVKMSATEALREQRADIIAAARMERLNLPRADDDDGAGEDLLALPAPDAAEEDAMDADGGEDAGGAAGWRRAAFKMRLDYSELSQRLKQAPRPSDRERLDEELRSETEAKAAALAKLEPNMKAIDQYEGVVEKERQQLEDLEECAQETQGGAGFLRRLQEQTHADVQRGVRPHLRRYRSGVQGVDVERGASHGRHRVPVARVGGGTVQSRGEVLGDAADETVQGHGTALRRREDHGGAGAHLRDPLLPQFAVLRAGRGGRGAGQDQRGEDGGVYPKQVARHRRGVRGPGVPVHRHLAQGLLLRQGGLVGGGEPRHQRRVFSRAHLRPDRVRGVRRARLHEFHRRAASDETGGREPTTRRRGNDSNERLFCDGRTTTRRDARAVASPLSPSRSFTGSRA